MMMMNSAETVENETTGVALQQQEQLQSQQQSINIVSTSTNTNASSISNFNATTTTTTTNKNESDLMPIKTNTTNNKKVNFLDEINQNSLVETINNTNTNLGSTNTAEYKSYRGEEINTFNNTNSSRNYSTNFETSVLSNHELNNATNKLDLINFKFDSTSNSLQQQQQQFEQEKQELLLLNERILTKLSDTNQFIQTEDNLGVKLNQLKTELDKENDLKPTNINTYSNNINNNNNKLNFETSSNESLNQIIKIKKIDINKIEDIYNNSNDTLFLNNLNNLKSSKIDFSDSNKNSFNINNNTNTNINNTTTFISEKFDDKKYSSDSTASTVDYVNQARSLNKKFAENNLFDSQSSSCSFETNQQFQKNFSSNNSALVNSSLQFEDSLINNRTRLTYPVLTSNKLNEPEHSNSPNLTSSQFKQTNLNSNNNATNSANMFHPTWDEWKRSHSLTKSTNSLNNQDSFKSQNNNNKKLETTETKSTSSTKSFLEETFHKTSANSNTTRTHSNQQDTNLKQSQHRNQYYSPPNYLKLNNKTEMKQHVSRINKLIEDEFTYEPPAPIVIFEGVSAPSSPTKNKSPTKSPKHYPVYPIDKQPQRAKSPVRLSSVVLARTDKIEPKEVKSDPPEPTLIEIPQPKKIKTILTTQKRKDSAPSLSGWRSDYDSDTDTQTRLLAKASGSIPIEYISIRRDPKPAPKKKSPVKKYITTGTNTSADHGKRIASTATSQDELPQHILHVSLDSLFVKSRREASTSTERVIKNASTETDVKQKDAFTFTDDEEPPKPPTPPPPPPPPPQPVENHYVYKSRKSRYSEWESVSNPPEIHEDIYRLEFLTISPRTVRRNNYMSEQVHTQENYSNFANLVEDASEVRSSSNYPEVRIDDDDRIIFGSNFHHQASFSQHNEQHYSKRSGSFPSLRPVVDVQNQPITRRYVRHTQNTSYATPTQFLPINEMGLMPAPLRVSNGFIDRESISQNINNMNSKFNEVFGQQQQQKSINDYFSTQSLQRFERGTPVKTERYYKFSRTRNEQVPSFGEIYHRNIASQASNSSAHYRSSSNNYYSQTPIVEMPPTPDSTLRTSSRQAQSINNSTIGGNCGIINNQAAHSSGYSSFSQKTSTTGIGGPTVTPLNESNNWYSSSTSVQQGFEPVVKQTESYSSSSFRNSNQAVRGSNREDIEQEEIFSSGNECMEPDRQFRPIIQPIEHMETSNKRQNFSANSYEYSEGQQQQNKSPWPNSSRS